MFIVYGQTVHHQKLTKDNNKHKRKIVQKYRELHKDIVALSSLKFKVQLTQKVFLNPLALYISQAEHTRLYGVRQAKLKGQYNITDF